LFCFSAEVMFAHFCGVCRGVHEPPCRSYHSESSVLFHSYGAAQFCSVPLSLGHVSAAKVSVCNET
jgi:hypothetical protein